MDIQSQVEELSNWQKDQLLKGKTEQLPLESSVEKKIHDTAIQLEFQRREDETRSVAIQKAKLNVMTDVHTKIIKLKIKQKKWDALQWTLGQASIDDIKELHELQEDDEHNCSAKEYYGYWITVSPPHDTPDLVDKLQAFALKCSKKRGISKYIYTFEQTGSESTLGNHPHVHMLVERSETASGERGKLRKGIESTFQSVFKMAPSTVNCKIKIVKKGEETPRILYCQGRKKGKEENLKFDNQWRNSLNLQPYYTNHGV